VCTKTGGRVFFNTLKAKALHEIVIRRLFSKLGASNCILQKSPDASLVLQRMGKGSLLR